MNTMISHQVLYGPVKATTCRPAGSSGARERFHCTSVANAISYPFDGVVDTATRQITFCKSDPPPVASATIPVSSRCLR